LIEGLKEAQKQAKLMAKNSENGNLKDMDKAMQAFLAVMDICDEKYNEIESAVESFDRNDYVVSGEFSQQMLEQCQKQGVDVKDLGNLVYEMFPNKVTVNPDTLDTMVDKKKYSCLRPKALIASIKADQEKLKKESFNADRFLNELEEAYDVVILKGNKKNPSADVKLSDVYLRLTPTARSRKEYSKQAFAFDIARLYASDLRVAKDGRTLNLSTGKKNSNPIRFLDKNGAEHYYEMISFI
jgi:hypothetical protein